MRRRYRALLKELQPDDALSLGAVLLCESCLDELRQSDDAPAAAILVAPEDLAAMQREAETETGSAGGIVATACDRCGDYGPGT